MKHSIRNRILIIFLVELLVVLLVSGYISYRVIYSEEMNDVELRCRSAAAAVESVVGVAEIELLKRDEDPVLQEKIEELMTAVLKGFAIDRIYMYYVTDRGIRNYLVTITNEDSQVFVAETHGLGSANPSSVAEQEEEVLEGKESETMTLLSTSNKVRYASWMRPYKNEEGEVIAVIGADIGFAPQSSEIFHHFFLTFLPTAAVLFLAELVVFIMIRRRVIRPIQKISDRMDRFDPEKREEPLKIRSKDEIRRIADSYEKMSDDIHRYIDNIGTLTAEKEKAKASLEIARNIQYGMVPASLEVKEGGLTLSAAMEPAKEVGGDFYDCFLRDDGKFITFIGDVSGKSIAGALFMAVVKTMLRERLKQGVDPATALNLVNDELVRENPEGMFVTVFCISADPKTGEVLYANAGHNPPLLFGNGKSEYLDPEPGIALGLFEDSGIENGELRLEDGDGILLYTDGITEAVNAEKRFFGTERLKALFSGRDPEGSGPAVDSVVSEVSLFSKGTEPFDDKTLTAVVFRKEAGEDVLPPELGAFDTVKARLSSLFGESPARKQAILAAEEAYSNIVNYSGASKIRYRAFREGDSVSVVFRDDGMIYDPFAEKKEGSLAFEDCDRGGMGIGLIQKIAKEASWKYENGNNVLTLTFER